MALSAIYTVQNPHITPSSTRANVGGREMAVTVDALEVELVSESPSHGAIKLRFIGNEIAPAQELFKNDAKIVASFATPEIKK